MREIVFDTETTGLKADGGDRLIEIGCVELVNHIPSGRTYHVYVNPEREVHPDALAVHGLDNAFLADKPLFQDVVEPFLEFVGQSRLVAHNAAFDRGFINMELVRTGREAFSDDVFVDTLALARRRHPGASNSLDALCSRYGVDNSGRTKHGALLDAEILSEVYIELLGGRQAGLSLHSSEVQVSVGAKKVKISARPRELASRLTEADVKAHRAFVEDLGPDPLWKRIWS